MTAEKKFSLEAIRRKAEIQAKHHPLVLPVDHAAHYQTLIHELHVHQIELEMQNEELRAIQDDLERTRGKYTDLFNNAPVGYLTLDRSGFIRECNQTFADRVGVESDRLVNRPFADTLTDSSRHIFLSQFKVFFNHPQNRRIDVALKKNGVDGAHVSLHGGIEKTLGDGMPEASGHDRLRVVVIDITDQWVAEKALAKAYAALYLRHEIAEIMLKSSDEGMYATVLQRLRHHLQSQYGYFGYVDEEENLVCPSMTRDVFPQCTVEGKSIVFPKSAWGGGWGESLTEKKPLFRNAGLNLPSGHLPLSNALAVPIVKQGHLIGQIVVAEKPGGYSSDDQQLLESVAHWIAPVLDARLERDRQQVKRIKAENDLRQAQRMESIGVLAGGIAHDFNNLLSPIIGYTDLMIDTPLDRSTTDHYLRQVSKAAHRAKDLVGQLLAYSRKQMLNVKTLDVNQCVEDIAGMLGRLIREDIDVSYQLQPRVPAIKADPGQIDQILMNLAVNAQDAMPRGGNLTIATGRRELAQSLDKCNFQIPAGDYTEISVEDTGTGIPADVLPYIFEPFFTTKERNQGTGMGLATCYGIVKQHEGFIWAESKPGAGTCFFVLMPIAKEPQPSSTVVGETMAMARRSRGETIMVVEDEAAVRKMAVLALIRLGYRIIEMDSPRACLDHVRTRGIDFDMLLSDVIMPGRNGKDLYMQLKSEKPGLKALFMSGYTDTVITDKGVLPEDVHFIGKPFTIRELSLKVRTVLDQD